MSTATRPHLRLAATAVVLVCVAGIAPLQAQETAPPAASGTTSGTTVAPSGPRLELVVEGLRGAGHIRAGAYADATSWLGQHAAANCISPVRDGRSRCVFSLPRAGTYAIGLYHDADDDREMDTGVFGIPTEGYGFSRNVGGGLSAPSFASAALEVAADALVRTVVRIRYGL